MGDALQPWWLAIAGATVTTLVGTIGKLWSELKAERIARASEVAGLRAELQQANDRVVLLTTEANARGDEWQREHVRDLRRFAGISTSLEPPRGDYPPPVIRAAPLPPRVPPRKPRE